MFDVTLDREGSVALDYNTFLFNIFVFPDFIIIKII